jgi:hypothetical protein
MAKAKKLKLSVTAGIGSDHIDLIAAQKEVRKPRPLARRAPLRRPAQHFKNEACGGTLLDSPSLLDLSCWVQVSSSDCTRP